jgi:UDP-N-acetyl-D-glucosamine dehydrogenase
VGVAYKKNIDDLRESPALHILEILKRRGAEVAYYDPHVPTAAAIGHEHPLLADMVSVEWSAATLEGFDCAVIVTDHDDVDYAALLEALPLVIDTRNATARLDGRHAAKVIKA